MNNSQDSNKSKFIPGTKLLTLRELVKKNQNERRLPTKDKTVSKAETQLMKWNPSITVHNDIVLALEGHHPYQNLEKERDINIDDTNTNVIIQQWYNENYDFFFEDLLIEEDKIIDIQKNDNGSSFLLTPIEPLATITPFATVSSSRYNTDIEDSQINNLNSRENIGTIENNHRRKGFETINLNTFPISKSKSLYYVYYQQPVPLNYFDTICTSNNGTGDPGGQLFDQQHINTSYQEHNNIFRSCLSWSGCQ